MKKALCLLAVLVLLAALPVFAAAPETDSPAVCLIEVSTGELLYGKQENDPRPPASTTKMMTALLALKSIERGELSLGQEISVTRAAFADLWEDASTAGLKEGDRVTVEDLLAGILLPSGGDAANALAIALAGSIADFAVEMNAEAARLGCENTHFVNAHGLPAEGHVSSAYDLARILSELLKYPDFLRISGSETWTVPANETHPELRFSNTDEFLQSDSRWHDSTILAGKTGYTGSAGFCLATAASRNGMTLLCVTLGADAVWDDSGRLVQTYADQSALYDWGFSAFEFSEVLNPQESAASRPVTDGKVDSAELYPVESLRILVEKGVEPERILDLPDELKAPLRKGEAVGKISIRSLGKDRGSVELAPREDVEARFHFGPILAVLGGTALLLILFVALAPAPAAKQSGAENDSGMDRAFP